MEKGPTGLVEIGLVAAVKIENVTLEFKAAAVETKGEVKLKVVDVLEGVTLQGVEVLVDEFMEIMQFKAATPASKIISDGNTMVT